MIDTTTHTQPAPPRAHTRPASLASVAVSGPLFVIVAAVLSLAEHDSLRAWGWAPLDHHGVPWPSSLALTSAGWLQAASFAVTGIALVGLARALPGLLPARRSAQVGATGLALAGAGLVCAALPLDRPSGDPAELASWVGSWHATVHVAGFAAAALGGIVALAGTALAARAARPRLARGSALVALVSAGSLALPGALGWYAFLAAFFGWTATLAALEKLG
jgi:hypothetical protein